MVMEMMKERVKEMLQVAAKEVATAAVKEARASMDAAKGLSNRKGEEDGCRRSILIQTSRLATCITASAWPST